MPFPGSLALMAPDWLLAALLGSGVGLPVENDHSHLFVDVCARELL